MNDNTVKTFRQRVYACFVKGQDSLLNLVDALASEDRAHSLSTLPLLGALVRLKTNRLFSRPAPAPTGLRGAPRKRGEKLQPKEPATQGDPSGEVERRNAQGKLVRVRDFRDLRLKEADWLPLTVIRVERPAASGTERDPRLSWFVWIGDQQAAPVEVALAYVLRFMPPNTATASISRSCCGSRPGCRLPSNSRCGVGLWPWRTICWCSAVIW